MASWGSVWAFCMALASLVAQSRPCHLRQWHRACCLLLAAVCPSSHLRGAPLAEDPVLLQEAKAEGLGPRHSLQAAQQVLTEPFLSEFTAEVASAEETGWFWKYELGLLEVSWPAAD